MHHALCTMLITCSEYLAHREPLFKELELLKIEDLYELKILKCYYNLSYGLLPSYFNCYLDVLNVNTPCVYTCLHIPMNALYPMALNVEFIRYPAIFIIVLKLNPCRS